MPRNTGRGGEDSSPQPGRGDSRAGDREHSWSWSKGPFLWIYLPARTGLPHWTVTFLVVPFYLVPMSLQMATFSTAGVSPAFEVPHPGHLHDAAESPGLGVATPSNGGPFSFHLRVRRMWA